MYVDYNKKLLKTFYGKKVMFFVYNIVGLKFSMRVPNYIRITVQSLDTFCATNSAVDGGCVGAIFPETTLGS